MKPLEAVVVRGRKGRTATAAHARVVPTEA